MGDRGLPLFFLFVLPVALFKSLSSSPPFPLRYKGGEEERDLLHFYLESGFLLFHCQFITFTYLNVNCWLPQSGIN